MRTASPKRKSGAPAETALYYKALTFSNLKCFQGEHTVNLCDQNGRPALWTLLLGENGVGKTTILQMLAWMRPVPPPANRKKIEPALYGEENDSLLKLVRQDEEATTLSVGPPSRSARR
jgi:ABC-type Mn2+/Zn2+ transport system ATPase subunit